MPGCFFWNATVTEREANMLIDLEPGDSIRIGDDVVISLRKIERDIRHAHIGVEAPRHMLILRKELLDQMEQQRREKGRDR